MGQVANVDYFYRKCNQQLGTVYTNASKQVINIKWLCLAIQKVYTDIHTNRRMDCQLSLSSRFSGNVLEIAVDTILVDTVIAYLSNFKKPCACDCACSQCNCHCNNTNCAYNCTCHCENINCNCKHCPGWPLQNDSDCDHNCTCHCSSITCTYTQCTECTYVGNFKLACECQDCNCSKTNCNCQCECATTCYPYECSSGIYNGTNCMP